MFTYREVKQDSLGYSTFKLLYGRTVRGPVSILRELMTNEKVEQPFRSKRSYTEVMQEAITSLFHHP